MKTVEVINNIIEIPMNTIDFLDGMNYEQKGMLFEKILEYGYALVYEGEDVAFKLPQIDDATVKMAFISVKHFIDGINNIFG